MRARSRTGGPQVLELSGDNLLILEWTRQLADGLRKSTGSVDGIGCDGGIEERRIAGNQRPDELRLLGREDPSRCLGGQRWVGAQRLLSLYDGTNRCRRV